MTDSLCVSLIFRNDDEKQWFLGQLSDGFGEDHVLLRYDGDLYTTALVDVEVSSDAYDHHLRMKNFLKRVGGER